MAGHSKWHNIRHKKAAVDAQKAKQFTKLNKDITIAARDGGGDSEHNPRLRLLLHKAKRINMPQENVQRAIKKGTGELPGAAYETHMYEGYGPHGIAIIIDVITDNKNRAISEIRHFFSRRGGTIAEDGAVSWMFQRRGVIQATHATYTEDDILNIVLEHDIDDLSYQAGTWYIVCMPQSCEPIKQTLSRAACEIQAADVRWIPQYEHPLAPEQARQAAEFLSQLDQMDDVQEIYTNLAEEKESL